MGSRIADGEDAGCEDRVGCHSASGWECRVVGGDVIGVERKRGAGS